jgi:hypothetical protein
MGAALTGATINEACGGSVTGIPDGTDAAADAPYAHIGSLPPEGGDEPYAHIGIVLPEAGDAPYQTIGIDAPYELIDAGSPLEAGDAAGDAYPHIGGGGPDGSP